MCIRDRVIVVGIGPGSYEDMTIRADAALRACDAIVGYPVYVDPVSYTHLDVYKRQKRENPTSDFRQPHHQNGLTIRQNVI